MVVGALRAVTAARLEMLWNALTKGSTRTSRASAAVVAAVGLILLVLSFYLSSVFGSQAGDALAVDTEVGNDESLSMVWLATFHALLVFGMGGAAGLRQRLGFDRELLRVLPLRTSQLLLAELPFGLLDTIPMLGLALFGGLGFGLMSSQLTSVPLVMLVAGLGVLGVLLMRQLVGVMTRPRWMPAEDQVATIGVEQNNPILTPGVAKLAVSAAIARSQVATSWQPAAVAVPCTLATTGCGKATIAFMTRLDWRKVS